ncbi:hypothetical protein ACWERY_21690 [Streptomyces sp. NPDC004082]|uniref:hypothetical protein n=1 Tax=unclassified Streptomyces TaxID=2593676 RepID=UPI0033AF305D
MTATAYAVLTAFAALGTALLSAPTRHLAATERPYARALPGPLFREVQQAPNPFPGGRSQPDDATSVAAEPAADERATAEPWAEHRAFSPEIERQVTEAVLGDRRHGL